jgi:hypothetical protein
MRRWWLCSLLPRRPSELAGLYYSASKNPVLIDGLPAY